MVHLETYRTLKDFFNKNLKDYIREHSGEYVIIGSDFKETFYKNKEELNKSLKKEIMVIGTTSFCEKIPINMHRFNKNTKSLEFLDCFIELCPNDNETILIGERIITRQNINETERYEEIATCHDCGYKVFRKPSEEDIKRFKKSMEEQIIL